MTGRENVENGGKSHFFPGKATAAEKIRGFKRFFARFSSKVVVLGYKDQEAADAVAAAYEEGTGLEDLIRKALKLAAGKKFS